MLCHMSTSRSIDELDIDGIRQLSGNPAKKTRRIALRRSLFRGKLQKVTCARTDGRFITK